MEYPWSDSLQLGLVVPAFFPEVRQRKESIPEIIKKLADDPFFQALEFSGVDDPAVQKKIAEVVRSGAKTLVFSSVPHGRPGPKNLNDLDEEKRKEAVSHFEKLMDEAQEYGCKIFSVTGFEAPSWLERDKALKKFTTSLVALSEYARKKNPSSPLTLAMENHYVSSRPSVLIGPTPEVAQILSDLSRENPNMASHSEAVQVLRGLRRDHPNIGLTFDTAHILQAKEDLSSAYGAAQDVITYVRLSNCLLKDKSSPLYGDKYLAYGYAGSELGIAEMAAFLQALKEGRRFSRNSYPTGKLVISLAVSPAAGQSAEVTLQTAKEAFRAVWRELEKETIA